MADLSPTNSYSSKPALTPMTWQCNDSLPVTNRYILYHSLLCESKLPFYREFRCSLMS